jgi:4-carboxymuconolactone decarboxylase
VPDVSGPDRLPPLPEGSLTPAQRAALDEISAGPRGAAVGPFVPLLRTPALMSRLQGVGEHLRFSGGLDRALFELTVLLVARHWDQQFEWGHHHPLALAAGLPAAVADAVAVDERPADLAEGPAAVWDLVHELHDTHAVSDETFARAVAVVGEDGVVELVAAVGYYTTLAMVMNTARTPAPPGPSLPTVARQGVPA